MEESYLIISLTLIFLVAGAVKGIIGLGLPTVTLALTVLVVDLHQAMVLLLVPSLVTNIWQAFAGGGALIVLRRIWVFLLLATVMVWPGSAAILGLDVETLTGLLGVLLILYAGTGLAGISWSLTENQQRVAGPVAGVLNGILTGMTGSFVVPGVIYLQSIGLNREQLMQGMGMLFTMSTLALGAALHGRQIFPAEYGLLSLAGLLPALAGMLIGRRIRNRISNAVFRRMLFTALLLLGLNLSAKLVMV